MDKLLTIEEVAALLGVRRERGYELARLGVIPAVRLGRQVRVDRAALEQWIRCGGRALPGGWRREHRSEA